MRGSIALACLLTLTACEAPRDPDREPTGQAPVTPKQTPPAVETPEEPEGATGPTAMTGATGSTGTSGMTGATGPTFLPPIAKLSDYAVNIIDSAAAAEAAKFLKYDGTAGTDGDLRVVTKAFYKEFPDAFDYIYVITQADVPGGDYGRSKPIHRAAIASIGHAQAVNLTDYGTTRLKNVIVLKWSAKGSGPTAHETLHSWGMHLDATLGFGTNNVGSHWGLVGANGQHGGFDPATLRCQSPKSATPLDCNPIAGQPGRFRYLVASFGTFANGGDTKPFSPIELYLMGLVPAADVQPILRPKNATSAGVDATTDSIDADGIEQTTVQQVVAKHGARPAATAAEKTLTGAFVVFSDATLSDEKFALVDEWAAVFGHHRQGKRPSFQTLTGGRATLSTAIGDPLP
ncbi:MAG: hypothetical protein IT381_01270 [Deltaproteobacteria bacterium]|nr:hypothetical protein [Deltaproteobacteria bacterium]